MNTNDRFCSYRKEVFFIELMMRHRIEMCGAGARGFARRTFRRYDEVKRFFANAQNDWRGIKKILE